MKNNIRVQITKKEIQEKLGSPAIMFETVEEAHSFIKKNGGYVTHVRNNEDGKMYQAW